MEPRSSPALPTPIFFCLAVYGRRRRVLHFQPIPRAPRAIRRTKPFTDDALRSQASMASSRFGNRSIRFCAHWPKSRANLRSLAATSRTAVPAIRRTGVTEYWVGTAASVGPDFGRPDDLAPLLGFLGDQLAEVGGRARKHRAAEIGKPRLHLGIGEGRIDLFVELVDNLGRRVFRRADAGPEARLVARHEFGNRRDVRQHRRACRGGHGERAKLAAPDVFDR